jgi:hypothetical protein
MGPLGGPGDFWESIFLDQALPAAVAALSNGTRPNSPAGAKPAMLGVSDYWQSHGPGAGTRNFQLEVQLEVEGSQSRRCRSESSHGPGPAGASHLATGSGHVYSYTIT